MKKSRFFQFSLRKLLCYVMAVSVLAVPLSIVFRPESSHEEAHIGIELGCLTVALEALREDWRDLPPDFSTSDVEDAVAINSFLNRDHHITVRQLDPAEALVYWLGGGEGRRTYFDFDQSRIDDRDQDGHPEYYTRDSPLPYVYLRVDSNKSAKNHGPAGILNGRANVGIYRFRASTPAGMISDYQVIHPGRDGDFGTGGRFPDGKGYCHADLDNISSFASGQTLENCIL